jgi:hypothetical protein
MMAQTGQDFEIWAGNDVELDVEVLDDDGSPLDISLSTLRWALTSIYDTSRKLIEKDSDGSEPGIIISSGGQVTITIAFGDTAALGGEPYYHELVVEDFSKTRITVLTGSVTVHKTIIPAAA